MHESDVLADPVVEATCTTDALAAYAEGAASGADTSVLPPREVAFASGERGFSCLTDAVG
ncbi:MAG TPA: hypothetical protein VGE77_07910 [Nocardioides sp.]